MALDSIEYGRRTVTSIRPQDAEIWEIISDVPRMYNAWPYVIFILSILLPGSGTMLAACVGYP